MTNSDCPICNQDYYNLSLSYWVCAKHQNWIVTVCDRCGQPSFSDCAGACMNPNCDEDDKIEYANYQSTENGLKLSSTHKTKSSAARSRKQGSTSSREDKGEISPEV